MRYFICSDIHSFYTEWMLSLKEAGYSKSDKSHILVILGDIFDRGDETIKVLNFIRNIPKTRRILVRGNHENLFKDLLHKEFAQEYDYSNGTLKTFLHLSGKLKENQKISFDEEYMIASSNWEQICNEVSKLQIEEWFYGPEWRNYFELDRFIFVHSFIPLEDKNNVPSYYDFGHNYVYKPNWRNEKSSYIWEDSRWGNPYKLLEKGLFDEESKKGKVLVFGHFHTCYAYERYKKIKNRFDPFIGKSFIALDACTVLSKKVNVIVIDDKYNVYDSRGNKINI